MACFPTRPLFDIPALWNPLEFLDYTYPTKTRGMGLDGHAFSILWIKTWNMNQFCIVDTLLIMPAFLYNIL